MHFDCLTCHDQRSIWFGHHLDSIFDHLNFHKKKQFAVVVHWYTQVWNYETGELVRAFEQEGRGYVDGVVVLDNGNIVCLHEDRVVRVWNPQGQVVHRFEEERWFNCDS